MRRIAALALTSTFAFSACSGASQTSSLTSALPQAPAAASAASQSTASDHKRKKQKLVPIRITVRMPHRKKRTQGRGAHYISPGSTQIVITLNTVNGNTPPGGLLTSVTTNLTSGQGGNCTVDGGTQSCTVFGPAVPVGTDNITFTAEDPSGDVLSTATDDFNVVAGQTNGFGASLLGVPASFTLSTAALTAGTAVTSQAVNIAVLDAAGDTIVGSDAYATPATLVPLEFLNDAFGAVKVSVNGGVGAANLQVTSPTDVVTLSYSGLSIAPFNLTMYDGAATENFTQVDIANVIPAAVCSDSGASVCASGPQVNLYAAVPNAGSTASLTVEQTGWTGSPWLKDVTQSNTCGAYGANIATVTLATSTNPGGTGSVFSVSTLGAPVQGNSCTITFKGGDAVTHSLTVPVTFTYTGVSVNGRHPKRPF
jgi:hypothetical protein